jgi:hypothetical protein
LEIPLTNVIDFFESYEALLSSFLDKSYVFTTKPDDLYDREKIVFLRHDVDFFLESAVWSSNIESSFGIKSTYFIRLGSPFYSVNNLHYKNELQKIVARGHRIGVHYDPTLYESNDHDKNLLLEKNIIENILGVEISLWSQHRPTSKGKININVDNISDVYSFHRDSVSYASDSGGFFRAEWTRDSLLSQTKLILLIHPEWWHRMSDEARDSLEALYRNHTASQKNYLERLIKRTVEFKCRNKLLGK